MLNRLLTPFRRAEKLNTPMRAVGDDILAYYISPTGDVKALTPKSLKANIGYGGYSRSAAQITTLRDSEADYALAYAVNEWVYRCIEIVATKVGELLNAAKLHDKATNKVIAQHLYYDALERSFKYFRHDVYTKWQRSKLIFGEAYTEKVAASDYVSTPFCLRWLNPLAIEPFNPRGTIEYFQYYGQDGHRVDLAPRDVTYDYTENPFDDYRGLSPMKRALQAVNLDMNYQKAHNAFFANGAQPGLIISAKAGTDWQDKDWEEFKVNIKGKLEGASNAYRTLPVRAPVDITTVELPKPDDSVELSDSQKERIAAVFGVPVGMVTFGNSKFQLSPEQRKSFYEETVIPAANLILKIVNADTLRFFDPMDKVKLELDLRSLAPILDDRQAYVAQLSQSLATGGMTLNNYLTATNQATVPNGDVLYVPTGVTVTPIEDIGKPLPAPQPAPYQRPFNAIEDTATDTLDSAITKARELGAIVEARHKTAEDELAAWRKAYNSHGKNKALKFYSYLIREDVQTPLRTAIDSGNADTVKAAFEAARLAVNVKAIQATRLDFEGAFENILEGARASDYTRQQFQSQLTRSIRRYGLKAYIDGLADNGVETEESELDNEDRQAITDELGTQTGYVVSFGEKLFEDGGISDNLADLKSEMWFNKSIMPFYQRGLGNANKNALFEWVYGDTEHCADCRAMNGQIHRIRDYQRRGIIPQASTLECGGYNCKCKLVQTNGKAKGAWV